MTTKLMQTIVLTETSHPVTDTVPLNFIGQFKPASPRVAEAVPEAADWPEITTVPAELIDDEGCPWKQSGFL